MSQKTSIEWTDATWNPVRGCSRVSPGCLNCYAEKVAARFSDEGQPFHLFAERTPKPHWTGKVDIIEKHLLDPLSWKKPRRIFVNSMSDLFHEGLPDEAIDRVFAVMSLRPQHTFQILTKRPERMQAYLSQSQGRRIKLGWDGVTEPPRWSAAVWTHSASWPLPNVWLGVSVENQDAADQRIPFLLKTPAAYRFVSYEPALGPVNFRNIKKDKWRPHWDSLAGDGPLIDLVIIGGESGIGARRFDIQWALDTVKECREAGVACFVKQLGAYPIRVDPNDGVKRIVLLDKKGGDMEEWPELLRVREFPL